MSKEFKVLSIDEIEEIESPGWLVDGILPAKSIAQIFGREANGKTFVALDIALRVAAGMPWMGSRGVRQGKVVYVVGEGLTGVKKRIRAWRAHNKVDRADLRDFWAVPEPVLVAEEPHINGIADSIERATGSRHADLIVFDTQARCTAGLDENSAEDMGVVVAALDWLKEETGASIMLIHHSPYNEDRGRGSSAVAGAIDTAISVKKHKDIITLSCAKQKDWEEFAKFKVGLKPDVEDSAVVIELGGSSPEGMALVEAGLTEHESQVLKLFRETNQTEVSKVFSDWEGAKATFYRGLRKLKSLKLLEETSPGHVRAVEVESGVSQGAKARLVS